MEDVERAPALLYEEVFFVIIVVKSERHARVEVMTRIKISPADSKKDLTAHDAEERWLRELRQILGSWYTEFSS